MKSRYNNKNITEICSTKSLASPTTTGNTPHNEIDHVMWEKSYISSKNYIEFDNQIFGYQLKIQGHKVTKKDGHKTYHALCKVKVYPVSLNVNGKSYKFTYDPVHCVAECGCIKVNWKEGNLKIPILYKKEFTPDEVYQKSMCHIENFITGEYLSEINNKIYAEVE